MAEKSDRKELDAPDGERALDPLTNERLGQLSVILTR
jgi:hypothetical protein